VPAKLQRETESFVEDLKTMIKAEVVLLLQVQRVSPRQAVTVAKIELSRMVIEFQYPCQRSPEIKVEEEFKWNQI
jgi:hypothetical protein